MGVKKTKRKRQREGWNEPHPETKRRSKSEVKTERREGKKSKGTASKERTTGRDSEVPRSRLGNNHRHKRWEVLAPRKKACVLVAGTRTFDDESLLKKELDKLKGKYDVRVVIVGDASGVDKMAEQWAYKLRPVGVIVHIHYADWKKHKKAAGPIRNQEMVDDLVSRKEAKKKIAVFFWDGESPGTFDCLKRCRKAKVKRKVVRYE